MHTFKNYFAIVFLVFSFQQNKLYPNGPIIQKRKKKKEKEEKRVTVTVSDSLCRRRRHSVHTQLQLPLAAAVSSLHPES